MSQESVDHLIPMICGESEGGGRRCRKIVDFKHDHNLYRILCTVEAAARRTNPSVAGNRETERFCVFVFGESPKVLPMETATADCTEDDTFTAILEGHEELRR